ncbi:hypothetical protein F511_29998 [Dorcoceras hygrometricum]|uniref:Splicing factor 3B subunit 1-like n=1 Tax=Dorcoceras hygrometricum TaxID=472368 RepID=A0A2Z7CSN8_9LAMI|nr:hypothetical protein F511_29998 [Dorcoceras hygrometricum]
MTFRVVRTNRYNQDLGLIHSTNGNHLESPNEGSSIDHQVTIHLHAQNITMFPTNETWYFASQMLVSSSGGLILILTAQSTRNEFRIHCDYLMCFMIAIISTITSNIHYEVVDEPVAKVAKKAVTKRRPAPAVVEPAARKKRTTVGRPAPAEDNLAIVTVAHDVEPISVIPAATLKAPRRHTPKRKLVLQEGSDDEIVDNIIHQVISETTQIETRELDLEDLVVMKTTEIEPLVETESRIDISSITNYDEDSSLKGLSNEEGHLIETECEKEKEKEKEIEPVADEGLSLAKIIGSEDTEPLRKVLAHKETVKSDEESLSIDDLLAQIPEDTMLPSTTAAEPTKIKFGLGIEIKRVKDGDWYKANLPQIAISDKGKAPLVEKDEIKGHPLGRCFL